MNYKLPTRLDNEYTTIESFEKFEYTHCFTYELARRNINVENSLNLLFELFSYYEQIILPILAKYEAITINEDMIEAIEAVENKYQKFFIGLIKHYNKVEFLKNFEDLTLKNLKKKTSILVQDIVKELYENYYIIYQHEKEKFNHDFNEIYDPLKYLERSESLTKHFNTIINNSDYNLNYTKNDYFTVLQDIHKDKKDFSWNIIYPNFNTALRDFTNTNIVLNLNISKDEIIDYIEKIKDDYDKKNSIIKTPKQLLEEKLEITSDVSSIDNNEKWADVFFIYDYYHLCKLTSNKKGHEIKKEIQIELTKYHGLKIQKEPYEIKNKKDTKYKQVSWEEYLKMNPNIDETNIDFEEIDSEKPYLSTKAIEYKYNTIKNYIEGKNPKYKTLIYK